MYSVLLKPYAGMHSKKQIVFCHYYWPILAIILIASPSWAIVCYHCDSISLPECAMTLNELDTIPYVNCPTVLSCTMSIVDTITYRGCSNDTPTIGATYSKSCTVSLCNKGVYPPGRLKCHHCQGTDCVPKPIYKPRPCLYHHEEDKCYTEVVSATEVYRGCASDINHTITADVEYCDINGCNDAAAVNSLECVQCDSNNGRGCKMDLFYAYTGKCNITWFKTCRVDSLITHKETCFTYHHVDRVVRGCTAHMPDDVRADMQHVTECHEHDQCNAICIPQQRCLNCNSLLDESCRSNATKFNANLCGSAEASSCYACEYHDWSIQRGCGKPPTLNANLTRCYECNGANNVGCNAAPLRRCYQCTTVTGAGCATWEKPGNIFIEECQEPAANCLIASLVNGTTMRGCQRADFNCNTTGIETCHKCTGNFCNQGSFPAGRLWCHQCADSNTCDKVTSDPLPCTIKANEPTNMNIACLEYYDVISKQVVRGCHSNAQLYYQCMLRNGGIGCHLCYKNGCNRTPADSLKSILSIAKINTASAIRSHQQLSLLLLLVFFA